MKKETFNPESQLPLSPAVFHILLSLADGERHGYAIMQDVAASAGEQMGPGTLYGAIKRLLVSRWIEEAEERPDPKLDDQRRRYYRLTANGQQVMESEAQRMAKLVALARTRGVGRPCVLKPA